LADEEVAGVAGVAKGVAEGVEGVEVVVPAECSERLSRERGERQLSKEMSRCLHSRERWSWREQRCVSEQIEGLE